MVNGPESVDATWTAGLPEVNILRSLYGVGEYDPQSTLSMEVVQGGGYALLGATAPNNPPMVKFSYNVGDGSGLAQQETILVTLDDNYSPERKFPSPMEFMPPLAMGP